MKYTCRRCGEIISVHDSWAHVCPEEKSEKSIEARVDCSDPVVYRRLHLPNRCLCKGCGKYTDTHYLYPGGETRCWECTFLPNTAPDSLKQACEKGPIIAQYPPIQLQFDCQPNDCLGKIQEFLGGIEYEYDEATTSLLIKIPQQ